VLKCPKYKREYSERELSELRLASDFGGESLSGTRKPPLKERKNAQLKSIAHELIIISNPPKGWSLIFSIANDTSRPHVMGLLTPVQQL
jgi:hypothetical protein